VRALCLITTLAAAATALLAGPAPAARSPICTRGQTTVERDPRGLLPLPGAPLEPAMAAARKFFAPKAEPFVLGASLAVSDLRRGSAAKFECGARVWQRTVVVYVRLRAHLPSRRLSQGVLFVGRFRDGYRVWQRLH
jgi:hypothetical protein